LSPDGTDALDDDADGVLAEVLELEAPAGDVAEPGDGFAAAGPSGA
jgi:hypothetical protein